MIKAITGTKDILPNDINNWRRLENLIESRMKLYNYREIRTPVFEETSLFSRGIGETTDIVSKEMYTFTDRSGTSITLKPEMTASVVRAYLEHNLGKQYNFLKMYYISPMFRQERPQAGRLRQFHQFGAEAIGSNDPALDAEMIELSYSVLVNFGLKNLEIKINSLGTPESREIYKNELRSYLKSKFSDLSDDSKKRFNSNILRIFDSKDETDQIIMNQAPKILSYLDGQDLSHFEEVKKYLNLIGLNFSVDEKLVRGLDYYTNTTFEIISPKIGSQSALCGGGRYNLLIEQLGGKPTPATGFAAGMERILLACQNENCMDSSGQKIDVYIVRIDQDKESEVFKLASQLRNNGITTEHDYLSRSVKAQMREANRLNSNFVIMVGGNEFKHGNVVVKNMEDGTQVETKFSDINEIKRKLSK